MPYNPDCRTPSRLIVNGERLPATTVDVYIRKEGSMNVGRYVEANFISPFQGDDYLQHLETHREDIQESWDTIRVDVKDRSTGEYSTEFYGVVTGLGNSSGIAREWQLRGEGPGLMMDKISASKNFYNATISDVFQYLEERFDETLPFELTTMGTDDRVQVDEANPLATNLSKIFDYEFPRNNIMSTGKTFKANQHSLANVIEWVRNKSGARMWVEPTEEGGVLVQAQNPTSRSHRAHYLDGDLVVVNNDALMEIKPINTLSLKSKVTDSLGIDGVFTIKETGSEYNRIKVRDSTLYRRAGNTEYVASPDTVSDATSREELESDAKSMLKQRIDDTSGGDMQTLLRAPVKPFDTVEAKLTCDKTVADTPSVTYEVSRVHHHIPSSGIPQTKLNVGLHCALEDIKVVSEGTKAV